MIDGFVVLQATGLRILLYLTKCLAGQAFPSGTIPSELQRDVKVMLLVEWLCASLLRKMLCIKQLTPPNRSTS